MDFVFSDLVACGGLGRNQAGSRLPLTDAAYPGVAAPASEVELLRKQLDAMSFGFNARMLALEGAVATLTGEAATSTKGATGGIAATMQEMRERLDGMQNCFVALAGVLPKAPDPKDVLKQVEAELRAVVIGPSRRPAGVSRLPKIAVPPVNLRNDRHDVATPRSSSCSSSDCFSPPSGGPGASPLDAPAVDVRALVGATKLSWDWPLTGTELRSHRLQVEATLASHQNSAMREEIHNWRQSSDTKAITNGSKGSADPLGIREDMLLFNKEFGGKGREVDDQGDEPEAEGQQPLSQSALDWPLSRSEKRQRAQRLTGQILSLDRHTLEHRLREARASVTLEPTPRTSPRPLLGGA